MNTTDPHNDTSFVAESITSNSKARLIRVGFGHAAGNDQIVVDAQRLLAQAGWSGGFLLINGPMSLPAAFVVAHKTIHCFLGVAVFDPKLSAYVVVASHGSDYAVGTLVDETDFELDPNGS